MNTLKTYVFPHIGRLPVQVIDTGLVLKCIEPIWQNKTETASRIRARIEGVLDWATVRGYRKRENPARWKGHPGNILPARRQLQKPNHHAALSYAELPAFMTALSERDGVANPLPCGPIKTKLLASSRGKARRISTARSDNGTRCSLPPFIRWAGTVHSLAAMSISSDVAPITSLIPIAPLNPLRFLQGMQPKP
jgi:integrase-like protein